MSQPIQTTESSLSLNAYEAACCTRMSSSQSLGLVTLLVCAACGGAALPPPAEDAGVVDAGPLSCTAAQFAALEQSTLNINVHFLIISRGIRKFYLKFCRLIIITTSQPKKQTTIEILQFFS